MSAQNSSLPNGWSQTTLAELATASADIAYGVLQPGPNLPDGIPMLRVKDIKSSSVDMSEAYRISGDLDAQYRRTRLTGGELLVSIQGTVGRVALVSDSLAGHNISRTLARIPLKERGIGRWLHAVLQSPQMQARMAAQIGGTTRDSLNLGDLRLIEVPIPPLAEQHRIVAKLDELRASSRAARTAMEVVPGMLEQYRQAVLTAAFQGDLTADWREKHVSAESGGALVSTIVTARASHGRHATSYNEEVQIALWELPDSWAWSRIGDLFDVFVGGTPSRAEPSYWGGEVRWVSSGEVSFVRIADTRERITARGLAESAAKMHPVGTVLLGMIGEGKTRGQAGVLDVEAAHSQNSAAIRVADTICLPDYVFYYLRQRYLLTRQAGSGNGQQALNKARVQAFELPFAPVDEQGVIVDRLRRQLEGIDRLSTLLAEQVSCVSSLEQTALSKAFRGELVPQDPADEPASALLARIRAERDASGTPKRTRRVSARV